MLFFVEGCGATLKVSRYTDAQYAPTDANKIEVYSTSLPEKKYIELAEIKLSAGKDVERIKVEASKLGADAIIINGAAYNTSYINFSNGFAVSQSQGVGIKCVAVKFKEMI